MPGIFLTQRASGVDWSHYKHPLPECVYEVYLQHWKDVDLASFEKL
jgi:hypothetical protein